MAWQRLDSSFLTGFEYDPSEAVLRLRFVNGREVEYTGVPGPIVEGLMTAPSPGTYYNATIKGRFGAEAA